MITFKDLYDEIVVQTHPAGLPENLVGPFNKFLVDALIHIQRYVECFQENNTQIYPYCSTLWNCKMSVVSPPEKGIIERVYTVRTSDFCSKVDYAQDTFHAVECDARTLYVKGVPMDRSPELQRPYLYPDPDMDRVCGRSVYGIWAIHREKVFISPFLHSSESLVIEWKGIKRKWVDNDAVHDDQDFLRAIKLFVQKEIQRDYEKDMVAYQASSIEWVESLRDLVYDCRQRMMVRRTEACPPANTCLGRVNATIEVFDDTPESTVFANIGDYGNPSNGTAEQDVADLVSSWSPDYIVTNGDNHYGGPANYAAKVGAFYGDYITDNLKTNRFWPTIGNHDYDDASLTAFNAFFTTPGTKTYYDIRKGPIHWFILDNEPEQADGRTADSIQAEWLRVGLLMSKAPWKLVVIHSGPFESVSDAPGHVDARWPFKLWGADLVLSGDSHNYERLSWDGLPLIINGAGGATGDTGPVAPIAESVIIVYEYGAIKGTASCTELKLEFINVDGVLKDTLVLTK